MGEKVINAALLGLGTVGTGVYKVLKNQEEEMTAKIGCKVKIRKILVRNLEKAAGKVDDPAVLTNSWEDIKADPSIDIIIELIGGIEPARTYILDALHAGKHVVTANKDLIAVHGKELMDTARASHVDFLFEAAVAGGIPIIRPLKQCLAGNHMSEVMGIVNGTTNFILTKMSQENMEFKDALALATAGLVGSDLANMINEAAINAVKNGRGVVSQKDLFESVEVVIAGKEKKDRILGDEEKHIVAYHEVGHALVMALQKESEPVQKITIVPRTMGALGYTMQRPEEEKYLNKKDEMLADLVSFFGGRAAEEVKFNSVTTGASNDIERATAIARAMVTQYGMSDEFGLIGLESITNRYLDGRAVMNCAETTAAKVDEVVMKMLKEAYAKAVTYIRENMDILDEAAEFLIQRETITGKEFMEIFNKYKNPVEESDKNVSETDENDVEISEAEVKTDSEIKTEEENTSTYNTGYAQWVEDDDDEE